MSVTFEVSDPEAKDKLQQMIYRGAVQGPTARIVSNIEQIRYIAERLENNTEAIDRSADSLAPNETMELSRGLKKVEAKTDEALRLLHEAFNDETDGTSIN